MQFILNNDDLMMAIKQVLIFDSGVGGLSTYREIIGKNPNINSFYLFDNAYFPYGELEDTFLVERVKELILSFVKKQHIDLIVIACNSASTLVLAPLRKVLSIPIVGVVPAIKPAAQCTKNGVIGLLATPATVKRDYTVKLINEFAKDVEIYKIGSTELVKLAEDKLHGLTVDPVQLAMIFEPWKSLAKQPDTLVLGCTHFPLLKDELMGIFGHDVRLVDSGVAIAKRVYQLLGELPENVEPNLHKAFYTKAYQADDDLAFKALQKSFFDYEFESLDLYSC